MKFSSTVVKMIIKLFEYVCINWIKFIKFKVIKYIIFFKRVFINVI